MRVDSTTLTITKLISTGGNFIFIEILKSLDVSFVQKCQIGLSGTLTKIGSQTLTFFNLQENCYEIKNNLVIIGESKGTSPRPKFIHFHTVFRENRLNKRLVLFWET